MPPLRLGCVMTLMLAFAGLLVAMDLAGCSRAKPQPSQSGFSVTPAPAGSQAPKQEKPAAPSAGEKPSAKSAAPAASPPEGAPASKPPGEQEPASAKSEAAAQPEDKAQAEPGAPASAQQPAKQAEMPPASPMEPPSAPRPSWMADYKNWPKATGYLISRAHGYRIAMTHASTTQTAEVFRNNAERTRHLEDRGFQNFPAGSALAMETWEINPDGSPGQAGPVFFMRKEAAGYDSAAGDWQYAMTRSNLEVIAEGKDTHLSACKTCHASAKGTDFVPPVDR